MSISAGVEKLMLCGFSCVEVEGVASIPNSQKKEASESKSPPA